MNTGQDDTSCLGGVVELRESQDANIAANLTLNTCESQVSCVGTSPSVGQSLQHKQCVRKPATWDMVADTARVNGTDYDDTEICTFKRGGLCTIHDVLGTKNTTVWKEWMKKKNGLFGFVKKQRTDYVCHFSGGANTNYGHHEIASRSRGVAKSNSGKPGLRTGIQTSKPALGGNTGKLDDSTVSGISGADETQTGSNMSERQQISSDVKDFEGD